MLVSMDWVLIGFLAVVVMLWWIRAAIASPDKRFGLRLPRRVQVALRWILALLLPLGALVGSGLAFWWMSTGKRPPVAHSVLVLTFALAGVFAAAWTVDFAKNWIASRREARTADQGSADQII